MSFGLDVNSNVTRGNKKKLVQLAVTTVKGYHLPRYKTQEPNKTKVKNKNKFNKP